MHRNNNEKPPCFICDEFGEARWGGCHRASTFGVDRKVRIAAKDIGDDSLLCKLAAGDMVAIDAQYHLECLSRLYHKAEVARNEVEQGREFDELLAKDKAMTELINCIESFRGEGEVLAMTDICKWFSGMLKSRNLADTTHTTRLRETIASSIPNIKTIKKASGHWDLMFDHDLTRALKEIEYASEDCKVIVRRLFTNKTAIQWFFHSNE